MRASQALGSSPKVCVIAPQDNPLRYENTAEGHYDLSPMAIPRSARLASSSGRELKKR
jgi:hypothetical protein